MNEVLDEKNFFTFLQHMIAPWYVTVQVRVAFSLLYLRYTCQSQNSFCPEVCFVNPNSKHGYSL